MLDPDDVQDQMSIPDDADTLTLDVQVRRIMGTASVSFGDLKVTNVPGEKREQIADTIRERLDMRHVTKTPTSIGSVTVALPDGDVVSWDIDWDVFDE